MTDLNPVRSITIPHDAPDNEVRATLAVFCEQVEEAVRIHLLGLRGVPDAGPQVDLDMLRGTTLVAKVSIEIDRSDPDGA